MPPVRPAVRRRGGSAVSPRLGGALGVTSLLLWRGGDGRLQLGQTFLALFGVFFDGFWYFFCGFF